MSVKVETSMNERPSLLVYPAISSRTSMSGDWNHLTLVKWERTT